MGLESTEEGGSDENHRLFKLPIMYGERLMAFCCKQVRRERAIREAMATNFTTNLSNF